MSVLQRTSTVDFVDFPPWFIEHRPMNVESVEKHNRSDETKIAFMRPTRKETSKCSNT